MKKKGFIADVRPTKVKTPCRVVFICNSDVSCRKSIQLFNSKCLPVLIYGLEACSLSKSDLCSINFVFNRLFTFYAIFTNRLIDAYIALKLKSWATVFKCY